MAVATLTAAPPRWIIGAAVPARAAAGLIARAHRDEGVRAHGSTMEVHSSIQRSRFAPIRAESIAVARSGTTA